MNTEEKMHHLDADDKYALIEVVDNGIGFDEKHNFFWPGPATRWHKFSVIGIGLAICRKIVEDHEGFIKVKSKEVKGIRFVIALPK